VRRTSMRCSGVMLLLRCARLMKGIAMLAQREGFVCRESTFEGRIAARG
jgi:hypothetical protein